MTGPFPPPAVGDPDRVRQEGWAPCPRAAGALALALSIGIAASACDRSPTSASGATSGPVALTPVASTADWPASTPEAEGFDRAVLLDLLTRLRHGGYGTVSSILIARNGRLVFEEYSGWSAETPHTLQSVTKSVVSLIVGIAIDDGALRLTDRVVPLMAGYAPIANMDAWKAAMTVGDLLTMRSGLNWDEWPYEGSPLERLNTCRCDWLRLILDWEMREQPGTRWEYVSGAPILLAGMVSTATGRRFDDYAAERLFGPLGSVGQRWLLYSAAPPGLPHAGGGLAMRPRDMIKLGQLVLDGGRWQGRQIVSESWIRESTRRVTIAPPAGWTHPVDYGYLWWLMSLSDPMNARPESGDVVVAAGAQGQWVFAVPRYNLVMAATGQTDADFGGMYAPNLLYTHVLAAIQR